MISVVYPQIYEYIEQQVEIKNLLFSSKLVK